MPIMMSVYVSHNRIAFQLNKFFLKSVTLSPLEIYKI